MTTPDLDLNLLTQWHDRNRQIIHLVNEIERLRRRIATFQRWLQRAAHVLKIVANDRNAAKERERITAAAYVGQQQSYRELEALYSAMTERAVQAELALKMTRTQLDAVKQSRDDWIERCEAAWSNLARVVEVRDQYLDTCRDHVKQLARLQEVASAARALRQHLPPDIYQTSDERALCAALDTLQEKTQ